MTIGSGRKESGVLSQRTGKVLLDCRDQVRHGEAGGQEPREFVKVLNLVFSPAQRFSLASQARCKIATDKRHNDKQQEIDGFLRIIDAEAVERSNEEEVRRGRGGDRCQRGWPD